VNEIVMNTQVHPNVNQIRTALRAQCAMLMQRIRDYLHQSDNPVVLGLIHGMYDADDSSLADMLADMDLAILGHEISEMRDIHAALKQLAKGSYGRCMDCGRQIEVERLREQPAARLCLACRTAFEKRRGIVRTEVI
jgi:DnaK suppressor protein